MIADIKWLAPRIAGAIAIAGSFATLIWFLGV